MLLWASYCLYLAAVNCCLFHFFPVSSFKLYSLCVCFKRLHSPSPLLYLNLSFFVRTLSRRRSFQLALHSNINVRTSDLFCPIWFSSFIIYLSSRPGYLETNCFCIYNSIFSFCTKACSYFISEFYTFCMFLNGVSLIVFPNFDRLICVNSSIFQTENLCQWLLLLGDDVIN